MAWSHVLSELRITASDPQVWLTIGLGLLLGAGCLLFGTWLARTVGLLAADAPAGETLGVGLASGLLVVAAGWAALWSGGRSSFTPVAGGFALALGLALVRRRRGTGGDGTVAPLAPSGDTPDASAGPPLAPPAQRPARRALLAVALVGAILVVAVALLYGATMAPSPRDGVQPIEFRDPAFYAVLGQDLARTGTETNVGASGFPALPGQPAQVWYHWGDLWLAAALISVFGTAPLAARYLIVLPLLLLACAALTGTLVRRLTGTRSAGAYLFGVVACLLLTPIPIVPGRLFDEWMPWGALYPMLYGIATYGLAAVAVLLALYGLVVLGEQPPSWSLALFAGTGAAILLPAHIVIAVLAAFGVAAAWLVRNAGSLRTSHRLPQVSPIWQRTVLATALLLAVTVAWGMATGHGLPTGGVPSSVRPFNATWRDSVLIAAIGSGVFLAIPVAAIAARRAGLLADLCGGAAALVVFGALAWGARVGDFNMFYVFYAGLSVMAMPVAAAAAVYLWRRLRDARHGGLALAIVALIAVQLEVGVAIGIFRMLDHGPAAYPPVPAAVLDAIRRLPLGAELAYACQPDEEVFAGTPALLALTAHTDRSVVPMCFVSDISGTLVGAQVSPDAASPDFATAPQAALYPTPSARPSPAQVTAFLLGHRIDYIYADAKHPNTLVPGAPLVARSGDAEVLRVP